jgi:hypothetical protein
MNRINKTLDTIYERINELSGVDAFGWGYSLFKKTKAILGTLITGTNKVLETSKSNTLYREVLRFLEHIEKSLSREPYRTLFELGLIQ